MSPLRHLLLAAALCGPLPLVSQGVAPPAAAPAAFELRGTIVTTEGVPLAGASISLRVRDSAVTIAGGIAGRDGTFRITGLRAGIYSIRVVAIGYSPVIQEITLSSTAPVLDIGVAKLAPSPTALADLAVREQQDVVVAQPDRTVYRAKDIAPGATNASEILENVPSVQVDIDGKVSLRGNENVVIQINGRPTPMRGTQLAAYLKSLPNAVVDRVEVVPNPSARYDPEGMAGIINIALRSNVDLGLSGSLTSVVSSADRYTNAANAGYQSGPWSTFASVGLVADQRDATGRNDRNRFHVSGLPESSTIQRMSMSPVTHGQNANLTVDYRLSPRDVLSHALMFNHRSAAELSAVTHTLLNGYGATLEQYRRPRDVEAKGSMFDYDVALKRTYVPQTHELTLEARYNRAHDEDATDQRRLTDDGYLDGRIDRNDAVTRQLTGQLDYLRPLRERTRLETGWKSSVRWLDRALDVTTDATGSGTWVTSPLGNSFAFREGVHAGYAVLSQGVGNWDLQAGLRGEYADRTFTLAAREYPYDKVSFFPSGAATYNVDQATQARASYSRRIRRPGTPELNPFPAYFDADNVVLGNPDLNPEYTDAYEFGLTRTGAKGMIQLAPFYRRTSDIIRMDINTADTLDGREVTTIGYRNLARSSSWGSDLTGQLRVPSGITTVASLSAFTLVTDGGSVTAVGSDAFGWAAKLNVTVEFTPTLALQGAYSYRAPMQIERGEIGAQQIANFVLRKKIQNDRGLLLLRVTDPFELMDFRITTGDDRLLQLTERNPETRSVFLGYQYSFGRPPRVRQVAPEQTGGGSVGFGGGTA